MTDELVTAVAKILGARGGRRAAESLSPAERTARARRAAYAAGVVRRRKAREAKRARLVENAKQAAV